MSIKLGSDTKLFPFEQSGLFYRFILIPSNAEGSFSFLIYLLKELPFKFNYWISNGSILEHTS